MSLNWIVNSDLVRFETWCSRIIGSRFYFHYHLSFIFTFLPFLNPIFKSTNTLNIDRVCSDLVYNECLLLWFSYYAVLPHTNVFANKTEKRKVMIEISFRNWYLGDTLGFWGRMLRWRGFWFFVFIRPAFPSLLFLPCWFPNLLSFRKRSGAGLKDTRSVIVEDCPRRVLGFVTLVLEYLPLMYNYGRLFISSLWKNHSSNIFQL